MKKNILAKKFKELVLNVVYFNGLRSTLIVTTLMAVGFLGCASSPKRSSAVDANKNFNTVTSDEGAISAKSGAEVATTISTKKIIEAKAVNGEPIIVEVGTAGQKAPTNVAFAEGLKQKLSTGDIEGALATFDTMDDGLKNDVDLMILRASLLISAGRLSEADSLVKTLQAKYSANKDVVELAIMCANARGDYRTQNALITQVLKTDPNNATANIMQGNQYIMGKKYKLARRNFQNALKGEPDNKEALFGLAQMCYYTNDLKNSQKVLTRLAKVDPKNPLAYQYMGKLAAETENYKRAADLVKQAIALDDTSYESYLDLGQYERLSGRYKEAEDAWTRAISLNPNYFLGYAYRAGLRDEEGRAADALADYNKVIETNPKYYFAYEEIGILEYHEKNYERAKDYFQKANSIKSNAPYQLMTVVCLLKAGKTLEAKAYSEKAMKPMDRASLEYKMMRLFHDMGPANSENAFIREVDKEQNRTNKGRFMFYLGVYHELKGMAAVTEEYYTRILAMQAPLFFEWRFAEWEMQDKNKVAGN